MESALSMEQRQQETPCPEVTLNSDDQMDVIHEKCNRLGIPTENTDNLPNGETVENHGEVRDRRFKEVKNKRWDDFETELQENKDTKGRDWGLIFADLLC